MTHQDFSFGETVSDDEINYVVEIMSPEATPMTEEADGPIDGFAVAAARRFAAAERNMDRAFDIIDRLTKENIRLREALKRIASGCDDLPAGQIAAEVLEPWPDAPASVEGK